MSAQPFLPLVDLQRQLDDCGDEVRAAVAAAIDRGDYILGGALADFERAWADFVGVRHAVGVGSGTDALTLALRAMGVGPGDVVVTQANTFVATALAVLHSGATLELCDVDLATGGIDPERYDGPPPAAVVPVHLWGRPADLDALRASFGDVPILEDAAQAHGARLPGQGGRCGSYGTCGAFSFYPSKNLGALGDGGAVTTDDDAIAQALRELRHLGAPAKYVHTRAGVNSRLDTLQAAALQVKLPRLDGWNARRDAHARRYTAALADVPRLVTPAGPPAGGTHVWHLYVVRVDGVSAAQRDQLVADLAAAGIGAGVHYPLAVHHQALFADHPLAARAFPAAEQLCREIVSLPLFAEMTDDEVDRAARTVRELVARLPAPTAA